MEEVKAKAEKIYAEIKTSASSTDKGLLILLSPAAAFILLGLTAIIAPGLIIFLIAAFCIFFGTLFAFIAFKVWRLKGKFEKMAKNYQGQVIVQGFDINDLETQVHFDDEEDEDDEDDLTFH